jgi:hypothetical protein
MTAACREQYMTDNIIPFTDPNSDPVQDKLAPAHRNLRRSGRHSTKLRARRRDRWDLFELRIARLRWFANRGGFGRTLKPFKQF